MSGLAENPPARLAVILPTGCSRAVIFRRGPSKWTWVLTWDTYSDALVSGDWHYGRLYEEKSDLSPSGNLLLYFASSYGLKAGHLGGTWTALCAPPSLLPVIAWPKGDTWGGGGHFVTDDEVLLNHRENELIRDARFGSSPVISGLYSPVESARLARARWLERQGWIERQRWNGTFDSRAGTFVTSSAMIHERRGPDGTLRCTSYAEGFDSAPRFELVDDSGIAMPLDVSWAGFDESGRLVAAIGSRLVHIRVTGGSFDNIVIADLQGVTPPRRRAPSWFSRLPEE